MSRRICFVLPRIGAQISGGAEGLCRELGEHLVEQGYQISAFATCALDNRSWKNVLPVGKTVENGIHVERFPVDERDLEKWIPIQIELHNGKRLSVDEELVWLQESVNSRAMYEEIERRQNDFDYFIFAPYLFGTTITGPHIVPTKSLLLPCLHDESYAYLKITSAAFHAARGCIFNAHAEKVLAERLYGSLAGGVVGMGFDEQEIESKPFINETFPYILYLGRKETGKNAHLLMDYFVQGKDSGALPPDLRMLVVGPGDFSDLERPKYQGRADIVDIGRVSDQEKRAVTRFALALVQPSGNESFSIVLMDAWLQKTPVLVNAYCEVTREHVVESNGGLYFGSAKECIATINELYHNRALACALGENGYTYVTQNYRWANVVDRFEQALRKIEDGQTTGQSSHR